MRRSGDEGMRVEGMRVEGRRGDDSGVTDELRYDETFT
jgi:hypothetical protein